MQRIGLLNGNNITYDKDNTAGLLASMTAGVIEGFGTSGSGATTNVQSGKALIECTRTNGEKVMVYFENTANVVVDFTGTKKVYIAVNQTKLDDGSLNTEDGTGVASIQTGASYPASNYIPLYSIASGTPTDARVEVRSKLKRNGQTANRLSYFDANGIEQFLDFGSSGQLLGSNGLTTPPTWQNVQSSITGEIRTWSTNFIPSGWIKCDGSAIDRTTYNILFDTIVPNRGNPTISIATPGVITLNSHGLNIGDSFYLTTTGALPTGLAQNTLYYVIATGYTANSFQFSATRGGTAINTSGTQSGTHTMRACPYGLGNGSTTFNVPNLKGSVIVGNDTAQSEFLAIGQTGGAKTHALSIAEMPAHTHTVTIPQDDAVAYSPGNPGKLGTSPNTDANPSFTTSSQGSGTGHNNLQPYVVMNYIIKF